MSHSNVTDLFLAPLSLEDQGWSLPRGLRNHNPLNIIKGDKWDGLADTQTDGRFCQFTSNVFGYRAAFIILRKYIDNYGCNTIRKIIIRWAPPSDGNHTTSYIRRVSRISNIPADETVSFGNCVEMVALVSAMAMVENGVNEIDVNEVREGHALALRARM